MISSRILVVDDERSIAEPVQYALSSEGFEVEWRETIDTAKTAISESNFDLLILDVGLPDGNGMDFCKRIRQESNIPIIFLTARSSEVDRIIGLELGGDDYVTKPFSPRELVARVKAILRRTQLKDAESTAPFVINERAFRISFHGVGLDLTRYEFRLLQVMLEHPGWVFSREDLMRRVWEDCGASMERTVDTHVKTIRAKLREIRPGDQSIVTRRGVGYTITTTSHAQPGG